MYRIYEVLALDHKLGMVFVAALVCIAGSALTAIFARRLIKASPARKRIQLMLCGLLAGTSVWSTHFLAMLAYDPGVPHGYDAALTAISFGIAVAGMLTAAAFLGYGRTPLQKLIGGPVFGLTVAAMHYVGMVAYRMPGSFEWSPPIVIASVGLGTLLSTAAASLLVRPKVRHRVKLATGLLVVSICTMHFAGMGAFTMSMSSAIPVPEEVISDAVLGGIVLVVTALIYLVGLAAVGLETDLRRESMAQLEHAAMHDHLTGLPNRLRLNTVLQDLRARMTLDETLRVAILTIDLDLFKQINDLRGHAAGDTALKAISARLAAACEPNAFVARVGGDEFIVLKSGYKRLDEVTAFAKRLHAAIVEPIETPEFVLNLGASIGIANSHEDGRDLDELIQRSDLAMYRAKQQLECHVAHYNAAMDAQSKDRLELIDDLRRAVQNDEFALVYQLQNDLNSLDPIGCEVLLRWHHPARGLVRPDQFIPLAEETGLIRDIGLWVLRTACLEAATWRRPFSIAVNVAPQQLAQPSFIENLSDILLESGLPPERLELEVTEASIIDDQDHALRIMHQIKDMGVRIAMDDFGTGYSSLATLQAFPFDKIKIDRSFVRDVHTDHQRAAIVRSTLLLGQALGIPVLAEGVEQEAELGFLRDEHCNAVQGFYFGRPLSLQDFHDALQPQEDAPKVSQSPGDDLSEAS